MKVSGFTFVRNGVRFDYPFEESIRSLVPLVDELWINLGVGEDETRARVGRLAEEFSQIKVFESVWDEGMRKGGLILAQQTNLALAKCTGDWGIYLQADEVLHEDDYPKIRAALERAQADERVEGLIFDYVHFYGDFFVVNKSPSAYRREVRAVRLGRGIESVKDAQGFRRAGEKLRVMESGARIFHYGWVRPPEVMREKTVAMDRLYHPDGGGTGDNYRYKRIYGLERFLDSHPKVMEKRVAEKRWKIDLLKGPLVFRVGDIRKVLARQVEKLTGWLPFEYRNYRKIR